VVKQLPISAIVEDLLNLINVKKTLEFKTWCKGAKVTEEKQQQKSFWF